MIFLLIAAFIGIILFEVPDLIRNKYWRELTIFSFLLCLAFVHILLQILNVKMPNPASDIAYFVSDMFHLRYTSH
jgi:hypothetical protein